MLNDKYAKKEIKEQVIRADQLISYIKKIDASVADYTSSDRDMEEMANFFVSQHKANSVDYVDKYRKLVEEELTPDKEDTSASDSVNQAMPATPLCPMCGAPMILRTAKKGENKGGQFYGCSKYPKCRGIRGIK
ncbi:MAG: topoisomerase DNA-binding C4 zinc finger domain-containing protein [Lachnospiraceae bacterium]|nr:topoisomerase DNA-binding C4 zinc finger domain-containing protein [Lachnospiraceae bacterium]